MVLQKRLDYGSSGHQVPVMPHVPRSAKGKRSVRKKVEDHPMCAFDLLATVAGKLLERENHATSFSRTETSSPIPAKDSVKQEEFYKETPLKTEAFDHKISGKSIISGTLCEPGYSLVTIPEKFSTLSPTSMESQGCKIEDGVKTPLQPERRTAGNLMDGSSDDPMDLDSKPPALVSSDSSVDVPPSGDSIARNGSFPKCRNDTELVADGDDDENSSGCTHPSTITSKSSGPQRIADRRIRKLMAAKYWKVAPTMFKDGELSDTEMKPVSRSRKICYTRQRTQRCSFKRRKLHEQSMVSAADGGVCSEGTSNSPVKVEASDSHANLHGENVSLSSTRCQTSSSESDDFYVKFSINSFKVPELFIEMPKTATVGSLKRTVMEAVMAILGSGLRVGVVHQGKKVRDDSKTLFQAGISHGDKLDNMGFTLEPNQAPPPPAIPEDPQFLLPCDVTEKLTSIPAAIPPPEQEASDATALTPPPPLMCGESDHDSAPSLEPATEDSKALVPISTGGVDSLAIVPLRKSRRSELVQRRIRRPFSVSEVEALVQAVEKLGTGRWRDVKLRAFDNAKHRTYVDLKDKWKTLVHTARISPQQRRGEPVPQELLDRVLAAHAHWTHLQVKPPPTATGSDSCLLI